jgi:coproporphyrinogen III oxidase-like Fe-S oxidoreductase
MSFPSAAAAPVQFDAAPINKLSQSGPRYTSCPTADRFSQEFGFGNYMTALAADGLLTMDGQWLSVTPKGRLLIPNICMVFDRHLNAGRERASRDCAPQPLRYSKTV